MSKKFERLSKEIYNLITNVLEDDAAVKLLVNKTTTPYEGNIPEGIMDRYKLLVGHSSELKVIYPYPNTNLETESYIQLRVYCPGLEISGAGVVDKIDFFIECFMSEDLIEFKENISGSYKRKFRHYELASIISTMLLDKYEHRMNLEDFDVEFFVVSELDSNGFRIAVTLTDFSG